ncbi:MAG: hypothetical protein OXC62_15920 [Aestuariivita sp.]|nr:hypothetical protein [Aestuariivita sp.]
MNLFNLSESEDHHSHIKLTARNGIRHHDFLASIVEVALEVNQPYLSQTIIKALNYQAIVCLHEKAGDYRPCPVSNDYGRVYVDY